MSAGHGHGHGEHGGNKRIALLISVLALVLAFSETLGKSAQTLALAWIGAGLGVLGVIFCVIGFFVPTAVHLF